MNKTLWIVVVLLIALAGTWFAIWGTGSPAAAAGGDNNTTFVLKRRDLDITLVENGTLVAKESKKLTTKIRGQGRITFLVPEGKEVTEGEEVCKLDTSQLEKEIETAEMSLLSEETELSTAKTDLEIKQAENLSTMEKAQNALIKAEKELERYRDGDAPQEMRKLQVALKDAETSHNRANKKYEDSLELFGLKYIQQNEVEDHKIEFDKAVVNKGGAELDITLFNKYTLPMTLQDKQIAVKDARRAVETAEKKGGSELLTATVAVTKRTKRVERTKEDIAEKKEDKDNMTLKAPVPGIVIYGDPRYPWNSDQIKIGGSVWEGVTLMTIPDLRIMLVKLKIHEADIAKVKKEQKAKISFDTYPGLVLDGAVTDVAQIAGAGSPWESQSEVKRFDVEITISGATEVKLKPGISAKAEIFLDHRDDALFVPIQCVFLEGGKHYCHLRRGDTTVRHEVKVGLSNTTYTEILEGLAEGDRVLLYNPDLPVEHDDTNEGAATESDAGKTNTTPTTTPTPE